eukprot:12230738-Alexandrium_andersonii.AAC.1
MRFKLACGDVALKLSANSTARTYLGARIVKRSPQVAVQRRATSFRRPSIAVDCGRDAAI